MTTVIDNVSTKPRILEILKDNPTVPYSTIANELGLSRERVRQIARSNGYPPRRGILNPRLCLFCGKLHYTKNQYCSHTCVYNSRKKRVTFNCHQCGKIFERTPGNMRSKSGKYFCNRACYWNCTRKNNGNEEPK